MIETITELNSIIITELSSIIVSTCFYDPFVLHNFELVQHFPHFYKYFGHVITQKNRICIGALILYLLVPGI